VAGAEAGLAFVFAPPRAGTARKRPPTHVCTSVKRRTAGTLAARANPERLATAFRQRSRIPHAIDVECPGRARSPRAVFYAAFVEQDASSRNQQTTNALRHPH